MCFVIGSWGARANEAESAYHLYGKPGNSGGIQLKRFISMEILLIQLNPVPVFGAKKYQYHLTEILHRNFRTNGKRSERSKEKVVYKQCCVSNLFFFVFFVFFKFPVSLHLEFYKTGKNIKAFGKKGTLFRNSKINSKIVHPV